MARPRRSDPPPLPAPAGRPRREVRPNGWRIFAESIIGGACVELAFFAAWILAYFLTGK